MLPVFVINLDRSTDRLALMASQLERLGLDFERFPGVNGTDLPPALKPYFCNASGEIVSPLRPAEIGCYASHLGVWHRVVESGMPAAMICEDDAMLPQHIAALTGEVVSGLPDGWDMVLLSSLPSHAVRPLRSLANGGAVVRYSKVPGSLTCYLISRSGAAKMLQPIAPRMWMNDHDTRWPWKFGMDTYGVHPRPVCGLPIASTIKQGGRGRSGRRRGLRRSPFRTPQSFVFNLRKLGPYWWIRCAVINISVKFQKIWEPVARVAGLRAARDAIPSERTE
jgi:glycosyl transferase, family 25